MKMKFALIALLLACLPGTFAQESRFVEINGTVETKISGTENWQPAVVGGVIGKDIVISTGLKSSAVVSVGSSTVSIGALTMLTLEEMLQQDNNEEAILYLRTGRVRAEVTPPTGQTAEFTVRSPTTTASVRGTSFSFNGRILHVHSGKVAFSNSSGQKVFVKQNQKSHAGNGSHQRPALPFEAEAEGMRPTFNDLDNTGSKRDKPSSQMPQVNIGFEWI